METAIYWKSFHAARCKTILDELQRALRQITKQDLRSWAIQVPQIAVMVTLRRGGNAKAMVIGIGKFANEEIAMVLNAWRLGMTKQHLVKRGHKLVSSTHKGFLKAEAFGKDYCVNVAENPEREARVLVGALVGFLVGSGGFDGDGGLPDLDLLGGIGRHRSLLTHTIAAGIIAETLVLSTTQLARLIHSHLPTKHDPLWDAFARHESREVDALCKGLSFGLAYHFAVDSTVDAGGSFAAFKGVAPATLDNYFQGANALVEAIDALKRNTKKI